MILIPKKIDCTIIKWMQNNITPFEEVINSHFLAGKISLRDI